MPQANAPIRSKEESFHERIAAVRRKLIDIEQYPLAQSGDESMALEDRLLWLIAAEWELDVANQEVKMLNKAFQAYGPEVTFV